MHIENYNMGYKIIILSYIAKQNIEKFDRSAIIAYARLWFINNIKKEKNINTVFKKIKRIE
jgi:hypothetical protein